jgi:hypothetical protein
VIYKSFKVCGTHRNILFIPLVLHRSPIWSESSLVSVDKLQGASLSGTQATERAACDLQQQQQVAGLLKQSQVRYSFLSWHSVNWFAYFIRWCKQLVEHPMRTGDCVCILWVCAAPTSSHAQPGQLQLLTSPSPYLDIVCWELLYGTLFVQVLPTEASGSVSHAPCWPQPLSPSSTTAAPCHIHTLTTSITAISNLSRASLQESAAAAVVAAGM